MLTAREIDKKAQDIFNESLPPGWLIRKQDPDIHIDYFVEIAERSKPSGVVFGVQLKGASRPRYSKSHIKVAIKTKHLAYYLDKVKQPIFLITVDTTKRRGLWLFTQKWAKNELKERNWKNQKKIDMKIPLRNSLSDVNLLRAEVISAEAFMRELWPSSIPAAIECAKESLEVLDRRVQVDISYQSGKTRFSLQAREPFEFHIRFRGGAQLQSRFADLFNSGKPAMFDRDEIIEVRGSPLLQRIFEKAEKGKLLLEPGRKIETVLVLCAVNAANEEEAVLYGVEGLMWAGTKKARFEGGLKETPLDLELSFPLPTSLGANPLTVNFRFSSLAWANIPVLRLPHFEKLNTFFAEIRKGCLLRIKCEIKGNHIFTATSQPDLASQFMEASIWHLQVLEKVRVIAREMKIDPIYPEEGIITRDEFENILLLHELLKVGEHRQNGAGATFSGRVLPNDRFFEMIENSRDSRFSGPLVVEPKDQKFTLFGKEFEVCRIRYTLTNPVLLTDLSGITADDAKVQTEGIDVQWAGGENSELIISRM